MTLDDLRPAIESRPAGALAKRVVPDYPGKAPPILPPAWLQQLRDATPPPSLERAGPQRALARPEGGEGVG